MRTALLFSGLIISALGQELRVPDGFVVQRAVAPGGVQFPMFATLAEGSTLFVTESSGLDLYEELQKQTRRCQVRMLQDGDEDGVYEKSEVFADQLVFPMGLAWREGKLYIADPPDLVTLEDTNGDGRSDKRTVLLTGFGHTDNGSLHGLVFGPDGSLYMTTGQPDGYKLKRADGSYLEGKNGALIRCQTDGSEVEVVCRGFENLVEIVFLPGGEIIGTDNWFVLPQDGVRDALVHLVPGGLYPLNAHDRFERSFLKSGILLPAVQTYPAVALSGLMRHSGKNMPGAMGGSLFSAQFNTRKVVQHRLTRRGASFEAQDEELIGTEDPDFHPSDVLEAPDGSILVIDTGSWYVHHCPTGRIRKSPAKGGIFRVSARVKASPKAATSAEQLLAETRKLGTKKDAPAERELLERLRAPELDMQLAAAEALISCASSNGTTMIIEALAGSSTEPLLQHTLTLALQRAADERKLQSLLQHPSPAVGRAGIVLLGQAPHHSLTADAAFSALGADSSEVRAAALDAIKERPQWQSFAAKRLEQLLNSENASERDVLLLQELLTFVPFPPEQNVAISRWVIDERRSPALRQVLLRAIASTGSGTEAITAALKSGSIQILTEAIRAAHASPKAEFCEPLQSLARNTKYPDSLRLLASAASLRRETTVDEETFNWLLSILLRKEQPGLRLSAVETLTGAKLDGRQFGKLLEVISKDPLVSPRTVLAIAQRATVLPEEFSQLSEYLHQAFKSGWQMSEGERQWLEKRDEPQAKRLLELARGAGLNDYQTLARLEPLLRDGDPNRGHQLFLGKAGCAACHRVGKEGGLLGPDLTRIGAVRSGRDILESVLYPSASIAQGFDTYEIEVDEGERLTGIRVRQQEDDMFVLRTAAVPELRIDAERAKQARRSEVSLMPAGLLEALTAVEIRDLLSYLQSLR